MILKHNDMVFVVVFSLNLHSVASYLWCSLELVVCTSDSFNCPEASYLVSVLPSYWLRYLLQLACGLDGI